MNEMHGVDSVKMAPNLDTGRWFARLTTLGSVSIYHCLHEGINRTRCTENITY